MYLEKVNLKNYMAIKEIELNLKQGINLLIGDNGASKTSVLEGIAAALYRLFTNVAGIRVKNIAKDDVRIVVNPLGDASTSVTYCEPVLAGCSLKACGKEFKWNRIKEELSSNTKTDDKTVCTWMKELTNQTDSILPLVRFQGIERTWKSKQGDSGSELPQKPDDRRCGYSGCLISSIDIKAIQQWCMKQEVMVVNKGRVREYETFKNIVK